MTISKELEQQIRNAAFAEDKDRAIPPFNFEDYVAGYDLKALNQLTSIEGESKLDLPELQKQQVTFQYFIRHPQGTTEINGKKTCNSNVAVDILKDIQITSRMSIPPGWELAIVASNGNMIKIGDS